MRCEELSYDFPDFVRGTLPEDRKTLINRHASGCTGCQREIDGLAALFASLDRDKAEERSDVDWGRFLVEMNRRIDAPVHRRIMPSPAARHVLYPLAFAVIVLAVLMLLPLRRNGGQAPVFSEDMRAVITSLDTAETAILMNMYVDPVTAPASILPVGTHSGVIHARDDIDASLVFSEIDYNDLLAASMEYLDQGTILEFLPAEQSRILMEEKSDNEHL